MVGQAEADLAVAKLPARAETIKAAENQLKQARRDAGTGAAGGFLSARIAAPSPGRIDDVIRDPGDIAGPSAPVLSMLPDGAVKLKVYVPEAEFSKLAVGKRFKCIATAAAPDLRRASATSRRSPNSRRPSSTRWRRARSSSSWSKRAPKADARLQPGQIVDVGLSAVGHRAVGQ